jgi:hypothetical protein
MTTENSRTPDQEPLMSEPSDQTNGLVDGLAGDSDGTADSDLKSKSDRGDDDGRNPGDGSAALAVGPRS